MGRHISIFSADGTLPRRGSKRGVADAAWKWRIDEKNNAYCRYLPKGRGAVTTGGYEENCDAAFRAPDGVHFFD